MTRPHDHPQHPPLSHTPAQDNAPGDALDAALAQLSPTEAQALRWLVRRADGLTAADEAQFQAWLNADPAHPAAFDDMAAVWQGLDEIPETEVTQLKAGLPQPGWEPTASTPAPAASAPARPPSSPPASARRWWQGLTQWAPQALAAGMAFALLGGGWLAWDQWQQQPIFSQHYATQRGQQLEARLPDGSTLRLDAASQAQVTLYRQRREVRLPEGQIMLTVQADPARPFDVLAGAMRITVVGTRFSVRHLPSLNQGQVQVAVQEGRVQVTRAAAATPAPALGDAIALGAGQSVTADAQGRLGPVAQVTAEDVAPWRNNRVNFDNTPLAQAVAELERYGNTGLRVRDPAVAALRVTGSVDVRRMGDFVRSLPQVLPVQLLPREGGTEVVASP